MASASRLMVLNLAAVQIRASHACPPWKGTLSDDDIRAVIAYIKTFWTPEQRRLQQESPMMP